MWRENWWRRFWRNKTCSSRRKEALIVKTWRERINPLATRSMRWQRLRRNWSLLTSAATSYWIGPMLVCSAAELPVCPPDWSIELVATAPQIKHPTVVCSAPDGRIFVAEDPMDISAPRADL